jgi:hypothetical protein
LSVPLSLDDVRDVDAYVVDVVAAAADVLDVAVDHAVLVHNSSPLVPHHNVSVAVAAVVAELLAAEPAPMVVHVAEPVLPAPMLTGHQHDVAHHALERNAWMSSAVAVNEMDV